MHIALIIIAFAIFLSALFGGLFALKFKDKLHLILGFSAGSVIGVAFFDLLPESFNLGADKFSNESISLIIICGFIFYMVLERLLVPHSHHEHDCDNHSHQGTLGAGGLVLHSTIDGLMVGLAFQASISLGIIMAVAILAHDFSDGINTVNMVLRSGGEAKKARKWLFADALAPAIGIIISIFIKTPENILSIIIPIFCGFFIYMGASDLLPESHHEHPKIWTTISTLIGIFVIYFAVKLAGI
jgi:ZIP family zinc transporter